MIDTSSLLERIAILESKVNEFQTKIVQLEDSVQDNTVKIAQLETQMQILEHIKCEITSIRTSLVANTETTVEIKTRLNMYISILVAVASGLGVLISTFGPKIVAFIITLL